MLDKQSLIQSFESITQFWQPHTIAQIDNYAVRIAKVKGEFPWHTHEQEDEFFLVFKGQLQICLRNHTITLNPNECFTVPKGVEHSTKAVDETWIVMFEAQKTSQYGD